MVPAGGPGAQGGRLDQDVGVDQVTAGGWQAVLEFGAEPVLTGGAAPSAQPATTSRRSFWPSQSYSPPAAA
jgi:hypothetical protein